MCRVTVMLLWTASSTIPTPTPASVWGLILTPKQQQQHYWAPISLGATSFIFLILNDFAVLYLKSLLFLFFLGGGIFLFNPTFFYPARLGGALCDHLGSFPFIFIFQLKPFPVVCIWGCCLNFVSRGTRVTFSDFRLMGVDLCAQSCWRDFPLYSLCTISSPLPHLLHECMSCTHFLGQPLLPDILFIFHIFQACLVSGGIRPQTHACLSDRASQADHDTGFLSQRPT